MSPRETRDADACSTRRSPSPLHRHTNTITLGAAEDTSAEPHRPSSSHAGETVGVKKRWRPRRCRGAAALPQPAPFSPPSVGWKPEADQSRGRARRWSRACHPTRLWGVHGGRHLTEDIPQVCVAGVRRCQPWPLGKADTGVSSVVPLSRASLPHFARYSAVDALPSPQSLFSDESR